MTGVILFLMRPIVLLTESYHFSGSLNVRITFAFGKAFINSLERNLEFTKLTQEAPAVVAGNRPGADWPGCGEIQLAGVSLRYRPDLPLVLNNISVTIGQF